MIYCFSSRCICIITNIDKTIVFEHEGEEHFWKAREFYMISGCMVLKTIDLESNILDLRVSLFSHYSPDCSVVDILGSTTLLVQSWDWSSPFSALWHQNIGVSLHISKKALWFSDIALKQLVTLYLSLSFSNALIVSSKSHIILYIIITTFLLLLKCLRYCNI